MIYIKLNQSLKGHPVDRVLRLQTDKRGVIMDKFWRRRVIDSNSDNCLEVLKKKPKGSFLNG